MAEYNHAKQLADQLLAKLSPVCQRIEIAGGVRRHKVECHDIELVAVPRLEPFLDMFGQVGGKRNLLNEFIDAYGYVTEKNGDRQKKIIYTPEINVDLFIVLPPAQWGVIFTLRTGSANFSHHIVTIRKHGGALPSNCRVKDGCVLDQQGRIIPMPEEMDFLNFLGLGWIEPEARL